jgi:Transglycosylase SLT domain
MTRSGEHDIDVAQARQTRFSWTRVLAAMTTVAAVVLMTLGAGSMDGVNPLRPAPSLAIPDNRIERVDGMDRVDPESKLQSVARRQTVEIDPTTGGIVLPSTKSRILSLATEGSLDIPGPALRAYRNAADIKAEIDASCRIDWALLAGIGRVESNHGRYGGAVVAQDGTTYPHILGVALDGSPGVAAISDTDSGLLDSDSTWDRAVGPMQFIPGTWRVYGADGDGDGVNDPHDLDDAALSAANLLCAGGHDLSTEAGARAAVFTYNHSEQYVNLVLAIAEAYRNGRLHLSAAEVGAAIGTGAGGATRLDGVPGSRTAPPDGTTSPTSSPTSSDPTDPIGSPSTSPSSPPPSEPTDPQTSEPPPSEPPPSEPPPSEPPPPQPQTFQGQLTTASSITFEGRELTLDMSAISVADFDQDGQVESMSAELTGLVEGSASVSITFTEQTPGTASVSAFEVTQPPTGQAQGTVSGPATLTRGDGSQLALILEGAAAADHDQDGTTESLEGELAGLSEKQASVTIGFTWQTGSARVSSVSDVQIPPA